MANWWDNVPGDAPEQGGGNWYDSIDTEPKKAPVYTAGRAPQPDSGEFKSGPANYGRQIANKESAPGEYTPDMLLQNMSPVARDQYVNDDIARSALTGTRKFLTGALGLPGMVEEYAGKGVEAAVEAAGGRYKYPRMLPNPEEVEAGVAKIMPNALAPYLSHEPKTWQGQVAETGMEILPGFATAGGAGAARRGALRRAPTQPELAQETSRAYTILDQAGLTYDVPRYNRMLNRMDTEIGSPSIGGEAQSLWNRMHTRLQQGRMGNPIEFGAMEGFYQDAGAILRNRNSSAADRRVAHIAQRYLDEFRGDDANLLTGNMPAAEARRRVRDARGLAQRNIKARHWEEVERTASELTDPGEYNTYVRGEIRKVLTNPNLRRTYSRTELDALKRARRTGVTERSLSQGGPFMSAARSTVAGAVGGMAGGPAGAAAGMGAAMAGEAGAKGLSQVARSRRLEEAIAIMRAGRGAHIPRRAGVAERAALAATGIPAVATETAPVALDPFAYGLMDYLPRDEEEVRPTSYGMMGIRG